jgi:hypothetical protein
LGNSIVPQVAERIIAAMIESEELAQFQNAAGA